MGVGWTELKKHRRIEGHKIVACSPPEIVSGIQGGPYTPLPNGTQLIEQTDAMRAVLSTLPFMSVSGDQSPNLPIDVGQMCK